MGKVYFDSDDNVRAEGSQEATPYVTQTVSVFPDGRCLFTGRKAGEIFAPAGARDFDFNGPWAKMNMFTQADRKRFFEENRTLLQRLADGISYPEGHEDGSIVDTSPDAEDAFWTLDDHSSVYDPDLPNFGGIWYEKNPFGHTCGIDAEGFRKFASDSNFRISDDDAERAVLFLDALKREGVLERVGFSADGKRIVMQLTAPLKDPLSGITVEQYADYTYGTFMDSVIPLINGMNFPGVDTLTEPERGLFENVKGRGWLIMKDPSGKAPGFSFLDLPETDPLRGVVCDNGIRSVMPAMLRMLNGSKVLKDIMKQFPEGVFPNFPKDSEWDSFSEKDFAVDRNHPYWTGDQAVKDLNDLNALLRKYAPEGLDFGWATVDGKKQIGFWPRVSDRNNTVFIEAVEKLYDQAASGTHPAFVVPEKGGSSVTVFVPKTVMAGGEYLEPVQRLCAAGQCTALDPAKNKGHNDFFLQENPGIEKTLAGVCVPEVGKADLRIRDASVEWDGIKHVGRDLNFVSVPSRGKRKSIPAPSSDPVDYLARFCVAARAGCDLKTSPDVIEGARKKFASWMKKHLCAGEYDKLFELGKRIQKREAEVIEELKADKELKKEMPVQAPQEPDDAGFNR